MTTSARLSLWGFALLVALGVLAVRDVAPARLLARGSDSDRAALLLEERFDEQIRGSAGERASSAPGVAMAALTAGLLGFALTARRSSSARAGLAAAGLTGKAALCAGGVVVLLGLGGPAGVVAAVAAAGTLLLSLRASVLDGVSILGPFVSVFFYLGVAVADVPALRSAAAAAAAGTAVGWAAAISLGTAVGRLRGASPQTGRGGGGPSERRGFGMVVRALGLAGLVTLSAGALLRPLPLDPADVAAPGGFHIVIRDPDGFRGDGFGAVYQVARALEEQEGVEGVKSIATFVPEATAGQAQNFFLSPLGVEPSEGLVAGTELTRLVVRIGVAPGSQGGRALVERARALVEDVLAEGASGLAGGRVATLVDIRRAVLSAYWGLGLALLPAWLALRLSGRDSRGALIAVGLAALSGAACLGFNALLPNTSPPGRLAPDIALTAAAGIAGAVAVSVRADAAIKRDL